MAANLTVVISTLDEQSRPANPRWSYEGKELNVDNSSAAQYPTIDVDTDVTDPVSGEKFLPLHPESFTHDDDGNLTQDGRWDYVWDGENRLVKLRSRSGSPAPERRVEFEYDWQGRRIRQTVWNDRDDGEGSEVSDTLYLYDGWNLIAELNANSSNAKVRTYIWGLDLSGSMQGAGGVGGLLMVIDHTGTTKRHYAAYDGNGNVTALVDSTTGDWSARYEYGPFGEPIRANGDLAHANPMRWSTKYTDGESGLVYYGYRSYNPSSGRWLSRDPFEQDNPYVFVGNNSISKYDFLGLWGADVHYAATKRWTAANSYPNDAAEVIGVADNAVDGGRTAPMPWGDQSYHFNRNLGGGKDSRLQHFETHKGNAERLCTIRTGYDLPHLAAVELGTGLHPLQDWVAHGDYGIHMTPTVWVHHNMFSPIPDFGRRVALRKGLWA